MLVRFFRHGGTKNNTTRTKGGETVKTYLLGTASQPRQGVKVLRGDPDITTEVINGSPHSQIYTSGVLSFAPDERQLTDQEKQDIMGDFEATLFVGLEQGQYSGYWVEHSDKDRQELHFVFANVELTTGKALPVYYHKTDLRLIDSWKTLTNDRYGLIDPNDRKRDFTPTHDYFAKANPPNKTDKQDLHQHLLDSVAKGVITSRDDMVAYLQNDLGMTITRQRKDSISVANLNGGKNLRLKGEIYHDDFNAHTYKQSLASKNQPSQSPAGAVSQSVSRATTEAPRTAPSDQRHNGKKIIQIQDEHWKHLNKRRERHQQRYCRAIHPTAHHPATTRTASPDEHHTSLTAGASSAHPRDDRFFGTEQKGVTGGTRDFTDGLHQVYQRATQADRAYLMPSTPKPSGELPKPSPNVQQRANTMAEATQQEHGRDGVTGNQVQQVPDNGFGVLGGFGVDVPDIQHSYLCSLANSASPKHQEPTTLQASPPEILQPISLTNPKEKVTHERQYPAYYTRQLEQLVHQIAGATAPQPYRTSADDTKRIAGDKTGDAPAHRHRHQPTAHPVQTPISPADDPFAEAHGRITRSIRQLADHTKPNPQPSRQDGTSEPRHSPPAPTRADTQPSESSRRFAGTIHAGQALNSQCTGRIGQHQDRTQHPSDGFGKLSAEYQQTASRISSNNQSLERDLSELDMMVAQAIQDQERAKQAELERQRRPSPPIPPKPF